MKPDTLNKLTRLARRMRWLCLALVAATVLSTLYVLGVFYADPGLMPGLSEIDIRPETIGAGQKLAVAALTVVTAALVTYGFLSLGTMFSAFASGRIFEAGPSTAMRRAGAAFFAAAIWGIVARTLTVLILTLSNPAGARQLSIGLDGMQMMSIVLAGLLFTIGHIHALATDMRVENQEFV